MDVGIRLEGMYCGGELVFSLPLSFSKPPPRPTTKMVPDGVSGMACASGERAEVGRHVNFNGLCLPSQTVRPSELLPRERRG